MSSSCKPKPGCFGSDIRRLLLAAEAGQKADILTYSSGHLGPRGLNQSQPHVETKQTFWKTSQSQEETPNPVTHRQGRTKALTSVKGRAMKGCPSECSASAASPQSEVPESRREQVTDRSSHADGGEDTNPSEIDSLADRPRARSQKKPSSSSDPEGERRFCSSLSNQEGLNNEEQRKTKQRFGRRLTARQELWAGTNVAEMHERKLQKELKKLSAQSWPSRDRLAVFSDVFDDVCESSPVFGRILREIKTDYDLYINHMMVSQSPPHDMSLSASLEDPGTGSARQMQLEDAEEEVYRLEQEARQAAEENKRVRSELQNVPAVAGPEDSDMKNVFLSEPRGCGADGVRFKRLQVLRTWRDIQQLEEEIKEKLVPTDTTAATERRIKDLKTETMRLIALNDRLKTTNKILENRINMVLNREKSSKSIRRTLWEEIRCDLPTAGE